MPEVPGLIQTVGVDLPNADIERLGIPQLPDITGEKFQQVEQRVRRGGELQLQLQDMKLQAMQQYFANKTKFLNDKAAFDARNDQRGDNSLASGLIALGGSIIQGANLMQQNRILEQRFQNEAQQKIAQQQQAELNAEIRADIQRTAAQIPSLIQEFGREKGTELAALQIRKVINSPEFQSISPRFRTQLQDLAFSSLANVEKQRAAFYLDQQEQIEATEIEQAKQRAMIALTPIVRQIEHAPPGEIDRYIDAFEAAADNFIGELGDTLGGRPVDRVIRGRILNSAYQQLGDALSKYHGRSAEANAKANAYIQFSNLQLQLQQLVSSGEISPEDADAMFRAHTERSGFPGIGEQAAARRSRVLQQRVNFRENVERLRKLEQKSGQLGTDPNNPENRKYKRVEIGGLLYGWINREDFAFDIVEDIKSDPDEYRLYGDREVDLRSVPRLVQTLEGDLETHKANQARISEGQRAIAQLEPLINPESLIDPENPNKKVFLPPFSDPITGTVRREGGFITIPTNPRTVTTPDGNVEMVIDGLPSPTKLREEQDAIRRSIERLEGENRRIQNNWYKYGIDVIRPNNRERLDAMGNEVAAVQEQVSRMSIDGGQAISSGRPNPVSRVVTPEEVAQQTRESSTDVLVQDLDALASGRDRAIDFNSRVLPAFEAGVDVLTRHLAAGNPLGNMVDQLVNDFTAKANVKLDADYATALSNLAGAAADGQTTFSPAFFLTGNEASVNAVIGALKKRDPLLIDAVINARDSGKGYLVEVSKLYREHLVNTASEFQRRAERSRIPPVPPPKEPSNPSRGVSSTTRGATNVRNYYTPRTRRANQKDWRASKFDEPDRIVVAPGHQDHGGTQHERGLVRRAAHIFGEVGAQYGFQVDVVDNGKGYKENGYILQRAQSEGAYAIELHMDQPGGASGVIPPTSGVHVYDDRLASEFGAFSQQWRGGLMLPKMGIRLLELTAVNDDLKSRLNNKEAIDGILRGYAERFFRSIRGGQQSQSQGDAAQNQPGLPPKGTQFLELSPGVFQFSNGTVIDTNTGQVRGAGRANPKLVPINNQTTAPMRVPKVSSTERGNNSPDDNYGYKALADSSSFRTALSEISNKYGINASWLADLIDFESAGSWSTSIDNGVDAHIDGHGYIGLIQVGGAVRQDFKRLGLPAGDPNYIKRLSQAAYVREVIDPYLDLHVNRYSKKKRLDSVGDLVAVIFGGAGLLDTPENKRNKSDAFGTSYQEYLRKVGERADRRYNTNSRDDRIRRAAQVVHTEPRRDCPICQAQLIRFGGILNHYDPR